MPSLTSVDTAIPPTLRVVAGISWRLVVVVVAGYLVVRALSAIPVVTIAFVVALLLTSVLIPVQRRLAAVIPRPAFVSTFLTVIIGLSTLSLITWFVITQITTHLGELGVQIGRFNTEAQLWLRDGPLNMQQADLTRVSASINQTIADQQTSLLERAFDTVATLFEVLAGLFLLVLSTFFLLRDGHNIWNWVIQFLPEQARNRVDQASRSGWRTLSGYMRALFIIALLHGVTVTILLMVLGIPLAIPLGVLILLGSFVPILGLSVTGFVCAVVALLDGGVGAAIAVAVGILILMQLEAHLLQPLIMSRNVEIHPLAVAMSVLSGATLFGIAGALLAVPIVAFAHAAGSSLRTPLPAAATATPARDERASARAGSVGAGTPGSADHGGTSIARPDGGTSRTGALGVVDTPGT